MISGYYDGGAGENNKGINYVLVDMKQILQSCINIMNVRRTAGYIVGKEHFLPHGRRLANVGVGDDGELG